jgi:hypothetical protein
MKRFAMTLAAGALGLTIGVAMSIPTAHAAGKTKVDCDAVMKSVNGGKKT